MRLQSDELQYSELQACSVAGRCTTFAGPPHSQLQLALCVQPGLVRPPVGRNRLGGKHDQGVADLDVEGAEVDVHAQRIEGFLGRASWQGQGIGIVSLEVGRPSWKHPARPAHGTPGAAPKVVSRHEAAQAVGG